MSYDPGDVVWFHNPEFPEKRRPHIIVIRENKISHVVSCSKNIEKTFAKCAFIEDVPIDKVQTGITIPRNSSNTILIDCGINCNFIYSHDLLILGQREELEFSAMSGDKI